MEDASKKSLIIDNHTYDYYDITSKSLNLDIKNLPNSIKVLLENQLRSGRSIEPFRDYCKNINKKKEILLSPARVLMQDFTGVPAVVDFAAMRDAVKKLGGNPSSINPLIPIDLVIDHSVQVDKYGTPSSISQNELLEYKRNHERYKFLKWAQKNFNNFNVVPPGTGICHQVNLEYLAQVVYYNKKDNLLYPDTVVGTDSHTTMINGLGVLGWGVGGIEAEAAVLGIPISLQLPEVIGFKLSGSLPEDVYATDLVLTIAEILRHEGVVGKFVEFYGEGVEQLSLADRATISNMTPEFGATTSYFSVDSQTIDYLRLSGRTEKQIKIVEEYTKQQTLWRFNANAQFTKTLSLNLSDVKLSAAGGCRPHDKSTLSQVKSNFIQQLEKSSKVCPTHATEQNIEEMSSHQHIETRSHTKEKTVIKTGDIVIAAITSCTNTSNPAVMIAAGLLAKNAVEKGLKTQPQVKTSLAPGSKVVTEYLNELELQEYLDKLGFNTVGYGCTTCIGNSGPLHEEYIDQIEKNNLTVCSVLSGNRNFEGRINSHVKSSWLASPPLVVAYALTGTILCDFEKPLGYDNDNQPIYLQDIWPAKKEVNDAITKIKSKMFKNQYATIFEGNKLWKEMETSASALYNWQNDSSYIQPPPFFDTMTKTRPPLKKIVDAHILAIFGDSITTDHISPAGSIHKDSPAAKYLQNNNIHTQDFNSYGSRRGNYRVMERGTFANIRLRNLMLPDVVGPYTTHVPSGKQLSIYDAAQLYKEKETPLIIIAGKEYGSGSSRDWAAKGTLLLGVMAVIAESFERIHRSNLIGMGVLPLSFMNKENYKSLNIKGDEKLSLDPLDAITPKGTIALYSNDNKIRDLRIEIHTSAEMEYYQSGGILQYTILQQMKQN